MDNEISNSGKLASVQRGQSLDYHSCLGLRYTSIPQSFFFFYTRLLFLHLIFWGGRLLSVLGTSCLTYLVLQHCRRLISLHDWGMGLCLSLPQSAEWGVWLYSKFRGDQRIEGRVGFALPCCDGVCSSWQAAPMPLSNNKVGDDGTSSSPTALEEGKALIDSLIKVRWSG